MVDTLYSRDTKLGTLYLTMYAPEPSLKIRTVECGENVLIDVNQNGEVVGIECLDMDSPLAQFIREAVDDE